MAQIYVLASASPRRQELIRLLDIDPVVCPSAITEDKAKTDPAALAQTLSYQKALDVAQRYHDGEIVIGADTCVYVNGNILGKPTSHAEAADMIRALSGNTHEVFTGVTIVKCDDKKKPHTFVERTAVTVFPMTETEIADYAALDEPMDKAGAYGIQGAFCRYIEKLDGDYFNVVGLPVGRLYQELKRFQ